MCQFDFVNFAGAPPLDTTGARASGLLPVPPAPVHLATRMPPRRYPFRPLGEAPGWPPRRWARRDRVPEACPIVSRVPRKLAQTRIDTVPARGQKENRVSQPGLNLCFCSQLFHLLLNPLIQPFLRLRNRSRNRNFPRFFPSFRPLFSHQNPF